MDKAAAEALIVEKVRKGTPVRDVYLHVFQPVQWEVGRKWQENEISVGMEHYITAATQGIMARLYEFIFNPTGNGRSMVATNVSGDLHDLGIRMVADFFEMEGWNTYYLGANTPQESILRMIRETNAELLAISATLPLNLPRVKRLISYIRKEIPSRELRIIVGGKSFNAAQKLWRKVGADGYASNADMALREINRLSRLN
jgi:methanogenic corrinoid protein MtbC1